MLSEIGLSGFSIAPIQWDLFVLILKLLFYVLLLAALGYIIYKNIQYKYWVIITEKCGDKDLIYKFDEAKKVKGNKLWLKGEKRTYPLIEFRYKRRCSGGGFLNSRFKKGVFFLYKYGEYSLTPIDLKKLPEDIDLKKAGMTYLDLTKSINNDLELVPIDSDIRLFQNVFEDMLSKTENKSKFNQLIPIIVTITCLSAVVGLGVIMMIMLKDNQAGFQAVASSFRGTADILAEAVKNVGANSPGFGG